MIFELPSRPRPDGGRLPSAKEEGQYWTSLVAEAGPIYIELWGKLRWAIGTSLGESYTRGSTVGMHARSLALMVLDSRTTQQGSWDSVRLEKN